MYCGLRYGVVNSVKNVVFGPECGLQSGYWIAIQRVHLSLKCGFQFRACVEISTECELHSSGFQSGVWTSVRIEELGSECGRQQEVWQLSRNWTSVQM